MQETQSRLRSKAAWAALLGLLGLVFSHYGLYDVLGITEGLWQTVTNALLGVLVAFGVLNNPTDPQHF